MQEKKSNKVILTVVIIVVVIGAAAGIYFATQGENENTNATKTTTTNTATNTTANTSTVTETDPYADLMKYDNKVLTISSTDGKVTGQVAISIDKTQTMPITVVYFMKVDDSLAKSVAATSGAGAAYYYIANHTTADAINDGDGTGSLSEAFCNVDQMPDVLAMAQARSIDIDLYLGCDAQYDPWHSTNTFYHVYSNYFNSDTFNYDSIIGKDTLAVFDSAPFYTEDPEIGGWGADDEQVISEGEVAAQYDLIYTE